MIDALDIDGEDSIDLLNEVARAFGIKISDAEAAGCETMGDLFQVICAHTPTAERSGSLPCLTALAFRSLRRAVRLHQPNLDLRPGTEILSFAGHRDHRAWHAHLMTTTGLAVARPTPSVRSVAIGLVAFCIVALSTLAILGSGGVGLIAVGLEAVVAVKFAARHACRTWRAGSTLGDLARETAARSVAQVIKSHGAVRSRDVWAALVVLVRPYTGRAGEIGRETRFFANSP